MGWPLEPFRGAGSGQEGGRCWKTEELNVGTVAAVKENRQLKLLSFHLRCSCGLSLLGLRGQETLEGFWPHQQCPLWVLELLLTAGGCLDGDCPALVLLRKHFCSIQSGRLILPFSGQ